ncbi:MAG TPA: cytochrome c maturation protein CcmE [Microthrixaceae bacterium]|nr:cytochrome c maturation protein CcmE [Microthrixaceae bacterium]
MDVSDEPTAESTEAAPLDLTPRDVEPARRPARRVVGSVVIVAVVIGVVAVLWNGLSSATVFFYNVDEAVAKQSEIGDKRFRMQGNVVRDSIDRTEGGVAFDLMFGGDRVHVEHSGEPPELFGPKIPIVVEGQFTSAPGATSAAAAAVFRSDRILIRHDNTYEEEHDDRLRDAENDARESASRP